MAGVGIIVYVMVFAGVVVSWGVSEALFGCFCGLLYLGCCVWCFLFLWVFDLGFLFCG